MDTRRCDLHTHSTHSDGTLSPKALLDLAKRQGLSCIALTDHDTLSGVEEAQAAGSRLGIEVISGIEISAICEQGTMHILGYFVDFKSEELKSKLEDIQEARRQRNPQIIEKLRSLGINITFKEVEQVSGGDQVGRPHFAKVLVQKGVVKNFEEAFTKYLAKGCPAYVDKRKFSSRDSIQMIESAGGIASLAHPTTLGLDAKPKEFEQTLDQLKAEGLKGLEVYSSCQSKEDAARYKKTADRLGLFVTGGSDFHGSNRPDVPLGWMGNGTSVSYETIDRMKELLLSRKLK